MDYKCHIYYKIGFINHLSPYMDYIWIIYGLYMDYIWIIYGLYIYTYMYILWIIYGLYIYIYMLIITYNSKPLTRTIEPYMDYMDAHPNLLQTQPCSKPEPRWQIVAPRLRGPASLSGFRIFALGALAVLKKTGRNFFSRKLRDFTWTFLWKLWKFGISPGKLKIWPSTHEDFTILHGGFNTSITILYYAHT